MLGEELIVHRLEAALRAGAFGGAGGGYGEAMHGEGKFDEGDGELVGVFGADSLKGFLEAGAERTFEVGEFDKPNWC